MSQSLFSTVAEAQKFLRAYSLSPTIDSLDNSEFDRIQQAIFCVKQHSEYQIIGICAEDYDRGIFALQTYSVALGYEVPLDFDPIEGAVYIKFNPQTGLRYISPYVGRERGVLVSCQSPNSQGINELYGHFPLDLFSAGIVRSQNES
ncbi:MAG: DUF1824 family protein [Cyanobacteriota bacterium]|nr:DUF1824 family protein [Cyanobacteriota bacterium]